ncbi:Putative ku70/Ku80 beta-barrel domain, SPOC-like domain superfamily, Ku domain superfamily protein [Septoria linicola]|uniref:ATP-dependent DNA helicase II subunit 2 n=1 Tax=Septoria linicola TaxID=215465 RepID=A0A9Q9AFR0_9PEZI|nr:Putative ku70/Ku80 beta-barrel domain, SPOC-like domain superfamily, Ku domain superfamily protein [Septoria linicola]
MASKEATVYILDLGKTMGEKSRGRLQSNLDWALEYFWDKITTTIATGRKTAMAGVIGLRTDESDNDLASDDSYQNISVLHDISQVLMPDVRRLRDKLKPSNTRRGDAIDALVIAVQKIHETCKKLQYIRKIVLITDGRGTMEVDMLPEIKKKITEDKIELVVLGVDFDDAEYGFKEENKDPTKEENETILRTLCEDCDGIFGTMIQANDELQMPRIKSVRPTATYRGTLTLGNPEQYEDAFTINVERYPKIMKASVPSSSAFVVRHGASQSFAPSQNVEDKIATADDGLSAVRMARTYQVQDDKAPGGKKDIERDELARGYEYGRTAVHISESDRNVTTFETLPGMDVVGFVHKDQYQRYLDLSRANMVISKKADEKASMALSSFIHALYELDSYAVARFVAKENKEPKLLLLAPNIEPDFECLYDVELPFAEDVRNYKFSPLDRVLTVSGKSLKVHRNLPTDNLMQAMSDYVDKMDLSEFETNDDGESTEWAAPDDTYTPKLHRLQHVIHHRAIFPESEPPEARPIVHKYAYAPEGLISKALPALERVMKAGEVKKVPPKARGKRWNRKETPKPLSDLDVAALLAHDPGRKTKRLDPKNAVPEFKQMVETADSLDIIEEACKQLKFIIFDWIKHSVGESAYGRAVEGIRVMREMCEENEHPGPFHDFLKELKQKLLGGELGGDRKKMWYEVRVHRLKPLLSSECAGSDFTEEMSKKLMSAQLEP